MKLSAFFVLIMAIFAIFAGQAEAKPKVPIGAIKKGGKIIKNGLGVAGAAGTAHEIYNNIKNKHH